MIFPNKEKFISKWLVLGVLITFLASMFIYAHVQRSNAVSASLGKQEVYISVKPGMGAEQIAEVLKQKQIISSSIGFRIIAKFNGLDANLRAGQYAFYKGMDYHDIINDLVNGKTTAMRITIPEGYSVEQIARLLQEKGIVTADEFKKASENFAPYPYITKLTRTKYSIEGFLFPDTYELAEDMTTNDILMMMTKEFDDRFTADMRERAAELNLSLEEVITLASLVEREAQVDEERPVIAQVFLNRLYKQMPLQSCATIQYILGNPKVELSVQDTQIKSPYNTYQNMGLPPGPIANPGIASIKAVLFSQPTEYLYFVADKDGRHHFSRTYEEHLKAIQEVR